MNKKIVLSHENHLVGNVNILEIGLFFSENLLKMLRQAKIDEKSYKLFLKSISTFWMHKKSRLK